MKPPISISLKGSVSPLFYFACFLSCAILFLILAGGLVTSHEAGLAVPDWPLSYGQLMPPMVGNVFWEHGHRMIAGIVGILTLLFAIWIQRSESRLWMKKLGWTAFGAVVFQALLGGLTVKMMLPPPVSIFHACLAQTFFCLIVSMTYFLSPRFLTPAASEVMRPSPRLFFMTTAFIYLQLILGATVRHAHQGTVLHILNAFLVFLHVALSFGRIQRFYDQDTLMRRLGMALGLFVLIQVFLGMGAFIFTQVLERGYAPSTGEVLFTAIHQTLGAVILAVSVLLSLIAARR
jgi:cytochrome c oxidase assembly protein subunit 15